MCAAPSRESAAPENTRMSQSFRCACRKKTKFSKLSVPIYLLYKDTIHACPSHSGVPAEKKKQEKFSKLSVPIYLLYKDTIHATRMSQSFRCACRKKKQEKISKLSVLIYLLYKDSIHACPSHSGVPADKIYLLQTKYIHYIKTPYTHVPGTQVCLQTSKILQSQ